MLVIENCNSLSDLRQKLIDGEEVRTAGDVEILTREEKQKAIDALKISVPVRVMTQEEFNDYIKTLNKIMDLLELEPLTDKEQRIFLAAMGREEKICREVDDKYSAREAYEDSLVSLCRSIERKVKKALWR